MKWTDHLPADISDRLGNCKTLKKDIPTLVNAKWLFMKESEKDKQGFTKEDAVVSILELLDCNGQCFDITIDDYSDLARD